MKSKHSNTSASGEDQSMRSATSVRQLVRVGKPTNWWGVIHDDSRKTPKLERAHTARRAKIGVGHGRATDPRNSA